MLRIQRRDQGEVAVIELSGAIDGSDSCRAIHDAIRKALGDGRRKVVFNLGGVEWVNSLGTGFLVAAAVAASREGATVRLAAATSRVQGVLEACGVVPHVWPAYGEEAAALESFAPAR